MLLKYRKTGNYIINIPLMFLCLIVATSSFSEDALPESLLQKIIEQEKQIIKKKPPRIRFLPVADMSNSERIYTKNLSEKIEKNSLILLKMLGDKKTAKKATVSILLDTKGKIISSKIEKSSGDSSIDEMVLQIIKLASPFGDIPNNETSKYEQVHISRSVWVNSK